ncbi:MAG: 3-phosphoshikimate 1-carboxyvinyltransferase [Nitrososphaerales archaeon]
MSEGANAAAPSATRTTVTVKGRLEGRVRVPPSKSYTHRAVLMASLAEGGESTISNALFSRDTKATMAACRAMGATLAQSGSTLRVSGTRPRLPDDVVNVENSGTTLRFMTSAFSAAAPAGHVVLTGDSSIRRRPMQPLLDTLGELGVEAWSTRANGCAPIVVRAGGLGGGPATIRGDVSSQFVSSLLISAPMAARDTTLTVADAVSRPYIDATLALSGRFGIEIGRESYGRFRVAAGQRYARSDFVVPADFSSASFVVAAVALAGGRVVLDDLDPRLPQGDSAILEIASSMGVGVSRGEGSVTVESDGRRLRGGTFNLGDTPDLLPVVAALALKCDSPVEVVGTAHARFKETDRIAILSGELSKLGVPLEERPDGMRIEPARAMRPALLDAHDDHRMFMAFSLASTLIEGGTPVLGVESLDVSYPDFLEDLKRLGATVVTSP